MCVRIPCVDTLSNITLLFLLLFIILSYWKYCGCLTLSQTYISLHLAPPLQWEKVWEKRSNAVLSLAPPLPYHVCSRIPASFWSFPSGFFFWGGGGGAVNVRGTTFKDMVTLLNISFVISSPRCGVSGLWKSWKVTLSSLKSSNHLETCRRSSGTLRKRKLWTRG